MILRMPRYCKDFQCIADRCGDNCCIGWEIDIDAETAGFYENVPGAFGERLKENISALSPKSFILGEKERCPFLNDKNLCDIILHLGEAHLCQICSDHPRYYEWFDGLQEGGIGLCCEEAARIILSQKEPLTYWDREVPDVSSDVYDTELYDCLFAARERILLHLENARIPFAQRMQDVLWYGQQLQERVDNGDISDFEMVTAPMGEAEDFLEILEFLLTLEPIDDKWIPYLKSCITGWERVKDVWEEFAQSHSQTERYLRNIAVYFVWRYFLKGVFDEEFLSRIKLMAVSVAVIGYLFVCKWSEQGKLSLEDCAEIAKNYSKELEYCEENLEALLDASYEMDCFSTKKLLGLYCR